MKRQIQQCLVLQYKNVGKSIYNNLDHKETNKDINSKDIKSGYIHTRQKNNNNKKEINNQHINHKQKIK